MSSLLSTSSVALTRPFRQVSRVTSWLAPLFNIAVIMFIAATAAAKKCYCCHCFVSVSVTAAAAANIIAVI